jgi:hypothetical protein
MFGAGFNKNGGDVVVVGFAYEYANGGDAGGVHNAKFMAKSPSTGGHTLDVTPRGKDVPARKDVPLYSKQTNFCPHRSGYRSDQATACEIAAIQIYNDNLSQDDLNLAVNELYERVYAPAGSIYPAPPAPPPSPAFPGLGAIDSQIAALQARLEALEAQPQNACLQASVSDGQCVISSSGSIPILITPDPANA